MAEQELKVKVTADTSQAQRELGGFKNTFTELNSALGVARQAVDLLKQGFEFAKQGAELQRTADVFDRLTSSIGSSSDTLLEKLREATGGIMSEAEMMSSASQIISLGLAKNEDDVVRLATVIAELGLDTSQVIMTMANDSTVRLDALGLSIEDVTGKAKEFEAAGMAATDAFDQAVLAALEDRVERVGSVSETSAGRMMRVEAAFTDIGNALKILFLPILDDAAVAILNITGGLGDVGKAIRAQSLAAIDARLTWEEYTESLGPAEMAIRLLNMAHGDELRIMYEKRIAYEEMMATHIEYTSTLEAGEMQAARTVDVFEKIPPVLDDTKDSMEDGKTEAEQYADRLEDLADAQQDVADHFVRMRESQKGWFDAINTGLAGTIEKYLESLAFFQAGGTDLTRAAEAVKQALLDEKITPEEAQQYWNDIYIEAQELEVQLGNITADEAAQNIANTLNVSLADAKELMDGVVSTSELLKNIQSSITFNLQVTGNALAISIAENIFGFSGGASFPLPASGSLPKGNGLTGAQQAAALGAEGLNFVVPPGYPNDSYGPIYVQSGEHVQVTPAGQNAAPGGGTTVLVMLDGEEIAARTQVMNGRDFRRARAAGSGRLG